MHPEFASRKLLQALYSCEDVMLLWHVVQDTLRAADDRTAASTSGAFRLGSLDTRVESTKMTLLCQPEHMDDHQTVQEPIPLWPQLFVSNAVQCCACIREHELWITNQIRESPRTHVCH